MAHEVRAHNTQTPDVYGGFTIGIDLKRAFDRVPRPDLFCDLHELGVDEACTQLLQEWHVGTRYWIEHKGQHNHVEGELGVRQGCRDAP